MKKLSILFLTTLLASCGNSDYLAKVGSQQISSEEFANFLQFKGVRNADEQQQKNLLKTYAQDIALYQSIKKSGIEEDALLQAEVENFKRNLLINRYFEKLLAEKVTDDAVKNYYANHASDYEEERARFAHILVRTNSAMTEAEQQHAKSKAFEAYSALKAGDDFAEVAQKYSSDTISAKKGGDLGWVKRGAISPVFSKIAFSLTNEQYSEPFQTEFGFHIVKLLEPSRVIKTSFNDVKGEIRHQLKHQVKQAELDRLLENTKITYK